MQVKLQKSTWSLGASVGKGGFGRVLEASSGSSDFTGPAVAKLVAKEPGAQREMLFADLDGVRNIVPIIDNGETDTDWVLIMPQAEKSLREHILEAGGSLDVAMTVSILRDIATTLVDLDGRVVHRDLKPENVLFLDRHWCLADFGISRYAEATTAADTRKLSMTPQYAAPEQWRHERATTATDIYALGVIAYELLAGTRPFTGDLHELREAHLHKSVPNLDAAPAALGALIEECLSKSHQARPTAANLAQRLERAAKNAPPTGGLAALQEVNRAEAIQRSEAARAASLAQSEQERREGLFEAAKLSFARITKELKDALTDAAPSAEIYSPHPTVWKIGLGEAELAINGPTQTSATPWGAWQPPAFGVIAHANINIKFEPDRSGYEGREHSLWFCDAGVDQAGNYRWYETAFMVNPLVPKRGRQNPFGMNPDEGSATALGSGITEWQLAWPFEPLTAGELEEFISRWAGWFADAAQGRLHHPRHMPERETRGSYRLR